MPVSPAHYTNLHNNMIAILTKSCIFSLPIIIIFPLPVFNHNHNAVMVDLKKVIAS